MFSKIRSHFKTDNFSYFIRYFSLFTLIFGLMTLIIFQLMRATMYGAADANFREFTKNPSDIIQFELQREDMVEVETRVEVTDETKTVIQSKKEVHLDKPGDRFRLNSNYQVILYGQDGEVLNEMDPLSKLLVQEFSSIPLDETVEEEVVSIFGETESYRLLKLDVADQLLVNSSGEKIVYALILLNTTQIKESISHYERTVLLVMIGFWLISIFASLYLAKWSLKPLLVSFQKQKEFVENASHELRTPLTVLQNRLENLFRKPEATILESSESIASSLEEVRNMRRLTTNLLNLARRDDGLKPEWSDASPAFFDEVLANFQMVAEEQNRQLRITNQLTTSVQTDKVLLKQLMTILFDNAVKYTEEEGEIAIHLETKDRQLVLSVADNGIGIADKDKEKIFDRFYRVDKARTRQKGGFGLGLSLAKQIVTSLGGTIIVQDNLPKGSLFQVKLPR